MKNNLFLLCSLVIVAAQSIGQPSVVIASAHAESPRSKRGFAEHIHAGISDEIYVNNVHSKALRRFAQDYGSATNVRWAELSSGYRVHFTDKGKDKRVYFDKKGNLEATVSYYYAKDLPRDIYTQVRSAYFDYTIYLITEIKAENKTVYLLKIEDENSWKTIRLAGGEMELVEDYLKS
jgi:hypothetical protein